MATVLVLAVLAILWQNGHLEKSSIAVAFLLAKQGMKNQTVQHN